MWRPSLPNALTATAQFYCTGIELYAATAFTQEARRTAGVTARRLVAAAAGTWMLAALNSLAGLSFIPAISDAYWLHELLIGGIGVSYFLAFATPRYLRARWQRLEQARYLSAAADRTPEERGRLAAADLTQAAARSVGHSLAMVALRDDPETWPAIVQAATVPSFVGLPLTPAARSRRTGHHERRRAIRPPRRVRARAGLGHRGTGREGARRPDQLDHASLGRGGRRPAARVAVSRG